MAFKSINNLLFCLVLLCFITAIGGAVTCPQVTSNARPCTSYVMGKAPKPSPQCCSGLQQLAGNGKTVADRKVICNCLMKAVSGLPGVQDKYVSQVAGNCGVKVGFPISLGTNCNTIR